MPHLFICRTFMPTLCHYLNCRNRANPNSHLLFCTEHINKSPVERCAHPGTPLFRGYCKSCFIHHFPNDPLTYQITYKSKTVAIKQFIFDRFDGFVDANENTLSLTINETTILVTTHTDVANTPNCVCIVFGTKKIVKPDGKSATNPMLWKRLMALESILNQEIENAAMNKSVNKVVYVDDNIV